MPENFNKCIYLAVKDIDRMMIASTYNNFLVFSKYHLFTNLSDEHASQEVAEAFDSVCAVKNKLITNIVNNNEVASVIVNGPTTTVCQDDSDDISLIALHTSVSNLSG